MVDSFQHARPFWWYVPAIFIMLFPWLWWVALWRRGLTAGLVWREAGTRFCLCILVPAFVIFSAISGKQPHYMLPLVAAASLVIARLFAVPGEDRRWERAWPLLLIALCGATLVAAPVFAARLIEARQGLVFPGWLQGISVASGIVLIAGSIAALRAASTRAAIAALSTLSIALLASLHVGLLALRPTFEVDRIAAFLRQAESTGTPVAILGDYEGQFHFAGRLTRPIEDVNHTTALTWAAQHPDGLLITVPQSVATEATPALVARYRGRQAVIWHARDVAARGPSLLNH
jgi:4-amino-4-deoxy-L-arabinose transferase-like glycosyltransferase